MGLPLIVFGLNGFFNFIPQPTTPLPEGAAAFAEALVKSGYMMQLIGGTQLIVGVLLVLNRFVPLALALFAPFMVNSIAFQAEFASGEDEFREPLVTMGRQVYWYCLYAERSAGQLRLVSRSENSTIVHELEDRGGRLAEIGVTYAPESGRLTTTVNGRPVRAFGNDQESPEADIRVRSLDRQPTP